LIKNSQPFGKKCQKTAGGFLTHTAVSGTTGQLGAVLQIDQSIIFICHRAIKIQ